MLEIEREPQSMIGEIIDSLEERNDQQWKELQHTIEFFGSEDNDTALVRAKWGECNTILKIIKKLKGE